MTNEQINRAVAEELGWYVDGLDEGCIKGPGLPIEELPDFCTDHNAAAEIRKAIKPDERVAFANEVLLLLIRGGNQFFDLINATPRQQAEAFLRMRGKWRDEG